MILLIHITIAVISVLFATYLIVSPSKQGIKASYGLISATLVSGTFMILQTGSNMMHACVTGLIYTAVVVSATMLAQRKLARSSIRYRRK